MAYEDSQNVQRHRRKENAVSDGIADTWEHTHDKPQPPQNSRELAERCEENSRNAMFRDEVMQQNANLIDLYVNVRVAEESYNTVTEALRIADVGCFGYHPTNCRQCKARDYWRQLESALSAARERWETLNGN